MFGQRLKHLRGTRNITQSDLAKLLSVSPSTIGMYEQGRRDPDTDTLNFLATYFNVSTDYLLGRSDTITANETFGQMIKRLRIAAGYNSLSDLYRASTVPSSTLSRIENDNQRPMPDTLQKLAHCLNVSYEKLMRYAGYLPDISCQNQPDANEYHIERNEDMEIDREIQAFKEAGVNIDRAMAKKIVEHRRHILHGIENGIDYILQAEDTRDAYYRIAELDMELNFDDETLLRLMKKARDKYGPLNQNNKGK